ncbi:beta-lactamase class A [Streptosporangium becharense]|uniref:Beta-lactamase class A n=1 Tax=Streptosporangium becharense TaxID=1816182 RepID=A0A7W9IJ68_9ACTN|nr:serine hydrolase [Streptosporangium becharense]MBB2915521.1 beta-lactamase class A [Streptosporangium becharense]MBB5821271.1 beta-lactamase class A [Streptosporangium becharense]
MSRVPAPLTRPVAAPEFPGAVIPRSRTSPRIRAGKLTRALDRLRGRYGGRVTAAAQDLTTGRSYRYRSGLRLPTASTSKVGILMALLLRTQWRDLARAAKDDAERMIRFSDNQAADRLYERIGLRGGLAGANRRFGLTRTRTPAGRCVDLHCWGITRTTAEDQVRLVKALAVAASPLAPRERRHVIRLMEKVTPDQKWGISAGACEGDRVALKNGWLRHVSNGRWAVASAGLIRGHGHDYAVAVLTEDSASMAAGIARVESAARRILAAFRGERRCAAHDR